MPKNNIFLYKKDVTDQMYFTVTDKAPLCEPMLSDTLHWHDYFEMEFIYDGGGRHIADDTSYELSRGCAYLLTPLDIHTVIPGKDGGICLYSINFNEYAISSELFHLIMRSDRLLKATFGGDELEYLLSELKILEAQCDIDDRYRDIMVKSSFNRILVMFLRRADTENVSSDKRSQLDPIIQTAVSYIKYNFREHVTVGGLAERLGLTPNYFGELFKLGMGVSFSDYIKRLRLEYAVNLLENSTLNINEVSTEAGFNSVAYFVKVFRENKNASPSQYRRLRSRDGR